jgi:hypothetical protein
VVKDAYLHPNYIIVFVVAYLITIPANSRVMFSDADSDSSTTQSLSVDRCVYVGWKDYAPFRINSSSSTIDKLLDSRCVGEKFFFIFLNILVAFKFILCF